MKKFPGNTIVSLLFEQATANPDLPALATRDSEGIWTSITFQDFFSEACRMASALRNAGLIKGDRVLIQMGNTANWEILRFGALLAGCSVTGVGEDDPVDHINFVICNAKPQAIFTTRFRALSALLEIHRSELKLLVTTIDQQAGTNAPRALLWDELLSIGKLGEAHSLTIPSEHDVAELIFTSGTSGNQKGIEYSHRQIMAGYCATMRLLSELKPGDKTICWLPMAHLFQQMANLASFGKGMTVYFIGDARQTFDLLPEVKPQFLVAVPRFLEKLLEALDDNPDPPWLDSLKLVLTGSAPSPPELLSKIHKRGLLVLEAYGITENTVPVAGNSRTAYRFGSVGQPIPENEIRFDEEGELLIRGPGLFEGYLGQGRPNERFTADGFYMTGDVARLDADGFLYITGRKSEIIKTSTGRRISPTRIETQYEESPLFDRMIVLGNNRRYLVGLVVINQEVAEQLCQQVNSLAPTSMLKQQSSEMELLVRAELEKYGAKLAPHEQVKRVAILPAPFSEAAGELTSTLKPRRHIIEQRYRQEIDELYDESLPINSRP